MFDHQGVIDNWLLSRGGGSPSSWTKAAFSQQSRYEQVERLHWTGEGSDLIPQAHAARTRLEAELPSMAARMEARETVADFIEGYCRSTADFGMVKFPKRLREARKSWTFCVNKDGKSMMRYDAKAGIPLLCPDDAREESMRLQRRYIPGFEKALKEGKQVHYMVFTSLDVPAGELKAMQRKIWKRYARLLKAKKDGKRIFPQLDGSLCVMESPLSAKGRWHVHLNVMVICGNWLDYKRVRAWWGENVHMERIRGGIEGVKASMRELIKYSVMTVSEKSHGKKTRTLPDSVGIIRSRSALLDTAAAGNLCRWVPEEPPESRFPAGALDLAGLESSAAFRFFTGNGEIPGPAQDPQSLSREPMPAGSAQPAEDACGLPGVSPPTGSGGAHPSGPPLTEWPYPLFSEWWGAHRGFRRTRAYGCLFNLEKPPKELLEGFTAVGYGKWGKGRYFLHFPLLEYIPGDKSIPTSPVDRLKRHYQGLRGPPDLAENLKNRTAQLDQLPASSFRVN